MTQAVGLRGVAFQEVCELFGGEEKQNVVPLLEGGMDVVSIVGHPPFKIVAGYFDQLRMTP